MHVRQSLTGLLIDDSDRERRRFVLARDDVGAQRVGLESRPSRSPRPPGRTPGRRSDPRGASFGPCRRLHLLDEPATQTVPPELDEVELSPRGFVLHQHGLGQVACLIGHVEVSEGRGDCGQAGAELLEHALHARPEDRREERQRA